MCLRERAEICAHSKKYKCSIYNVWAFPALQNIWALCNLLLHSEAQAENTKGW